MRSDEERPAVRGWVWWYGLFLGCLLIVAGAAETVRAVSSGDGGLVFWFGTLVGGGVFVLTTVGCVAGLLPTMWTLIGPVMLVALIIVSGSRAAAAPVRSG